MPHRHRQRRRRHRTTTTTTQNQARVTVNNLIIIIMGYFLMRFASFVGFLFHAALNWPSMLRTQTNRHTGLSDARRRTSIRQQFELACYKTDYCIRTERLRTQNSAQSVSRHTATYQNIQPQKTLKL